MPIILLSIDNAMRLIRFALYIQSMFLAADLRRVEAPDYSLYKLSIYVPDGGLKFRITLYI